MWTISEIRTIEKSAYAVSTPLPLVRFPPAGPRMRTIFVGFSQDLSAKANFWMGATTLASRKLVRIVEIERISVVVLKGGAAERIVRPLENFGEPTTDFPSFDSPGLQFTSQPMSSVRGFGFSTSSLPKRR
jgi:hypothetical protein